MMDVNEGKSKSHKINREIPLKTNPEDKPPASNPTKRLCNRGRFSNCICEKKHEDEPISRVSRLDKSNNHTL